MKLLKLQSHWSGSISASCGFITVCCCKEQARDKTQVVLPSQFSSVKRKPQENQLGRGQQTEKGQATPTQGMGSCISPLDRVKLVLALWGTGGRGVGGAHKRWQGMLAITRSVRSKAS